MRGLYTQCTLPCHYFGVNHWNGGRGTVETFTEAQVWNLNGRSEVVVLSGSGPTLTRTHCSWPELPGRQRYLETPRNSTYLYSKIVGFLEWPDKLKVGLSSSNALVNYIVYTTVTTVVCSIGSSTSDKTQLNWRYSLCPLWTTPLPILTHSSLGVSSIFRPTTRVVNYTTNTETTDDPHDRGTRATLNRLCVIRRGTH